MPAKIIYQKNPKISVIIPTLKKDEKSLSLLISQIKEQTEKNLEIILVQNERPNGHARNVGVKKARGKYLICLDDDVTLEGNKVFENLIKPFENKKIGMTGASCLIPKDTNKIGRGYGKIRDFEVPIVKKITDSDRVQHACCAFKTKVYKDIGWESDTLITGTDDDIRYRLRKNGFRVVLIPNTLVYHRPPETFKSIIKGSWNKGAGAAFALKNVPYVFPYPKIFNHQIKNKLAIILYFILTLLIKIVVFAIKGKFIRLIFDFFQTAGLLYGYFKF